jgi:hypothetical protein
LFLSSFCLHLVVVLQNIQFNGRCRQEVWPLIAVIIYTRIVNHASQNMPTIEVLKNIIYIQIVKLFLKKMAEIQNLVRQSILSCLKRRILVRQDKEQIDSYRKIRSRNLLLK